MGDTVNTVYYFLSFLNSFQQNPTHDTPSHPKGTGNFSV